MAHLRGILLLAHPLGWCPQVLRYPQTSSAPEIPNLTRPDPCAPGDPRPPGAQMSAAAKSPEGSGLDTPSPLNVKEKRGPLQNGRCGQDRSPGPQLAPASARHPTLPGAQPREGPWLPTLSPSSCPRILPPPPRPSAPTSGDAVVQAAEMGGRGQECALPRGRPPPGRTGDRGPRTTSPSAKFWHPLPRTPPAGRPARCAQTEKKPLPEHWVPPLPTSCLCVPPGGPSLDALREPAAPSCANPEVQGHRVPTWGPWVTRGIVPGSGAPSSTPGRGPYGLTRGVRGGLAPGPGGGEDQHREEQRRRRGPHGGRRAGWRAVMWHSGRGAAPRGLPPPTSAESDYSTAAPGAAQSEAAAGGTKERAARFRADAPPRAVGAPLGARFLPPP